MAMMKAGVVTAPGKLEVLERPIPTPKEHEVLIKVEACGLCHSDCFCKDAQWPGLKLPRAPGHELVGTITAVGSHVTNRKVGQRVGVGWLGSACGNCVACKSSDNNICCKNAVITGLGSDGGYQQYVTYGAEFTAVVPEGLSSVDAAPLMCAGLTVYNGLRRSDARPGDLVAVSGIGGLGHLAVQYSHKMGFKTVAISSSDDKAKLAKELGADLYLNTKTQNVGEELQKLGGAKVIVATVFDSKTMSSLVGGLGIGGQLLVAGVPHEPLQIPAATLVMNRASVVGLCSGNARDSEDTLNFSVLTGVRPRVEVFNFPDVNAAYDRMVSGKALFRVVLKY